MGDRDEELKQVIEEAQRLSQALEERWRVLRKTSGETELICVNCREKIHVRFDANFCTRCGSGLRESWLEYITLWDEATQRGWVKSVVGKLNSKSQDPNEIRGQT